MFCSTTRPSERDELLAAVRHLSTRVPHADSAEHLTRDEHAIYWRGYYKAICTALAVMDLVLERRARRAAERRRAGESGRCITRSGTTQRGRAAGRRASCGSSFAASG
jgi:hypothetical protein